MNYVKTSFFKKTIQQKTREAGARNPYNLMVKVMGLSTSTARKYAKWLSTKVERLQTKTIRKFCRDFGIQLDELERRNVFLNTKYPVNINSKDISKLKTHILNEGTLIRAGGITGVVRYSNQDPVLHSYFRKMVEKTGGRNLNPPFPSDEGLISSGYSATARILHAAGLPYGPKTLTNPSIDELVLKDLEVRKYHFQATLDEEGTSYIQLKGNSVKMAIKWTRQIDVTDHLTKDMQKELTEIAVQRGRRIPLGAIDNPQTKTVIYQHLPLALDQELGVLKASHRDQVSEEEWPKLYAKRVQISKKGRITAPWEISTSRRKIIDLIHDEYGMLPGTRKAERFEQQYELYSKCRGGELSDDEARKVKKLIKQIPKGVDEEWVTQKMSEFFPTAEWSKDPERAREVFKKWRREKKSRS